MPTSDIKKGPLYVDSTNNRVGIGTISPLITLDIQADSGTNIPLIVRGGSSQTNAFIAIRDTNTTGDLYNRIGSVGDNLVLYTNQTERVRLDSSGNVGIGTTSPSAKLMLQDSSGVEIRLNPQLEGTDRTWRVKANSWDGSGYPFTISDYTSERMRINSSGNVGIGTSSPDAPMTIQRPSNNQGVSSGISLKGQDGTTQGGLGTDGVNDNAVQLVANQFIKFHTNNTDGTTNERMRIDSSGNVGIGVVPSGYLTSGYALRLDGGAQTYIAFNNNTHTTQVTGGFVIGNDSGSARITQRENQPIIIETNNTEQMRIDSSGNVLVGTTVLTDVSSSGTGGEGAYIKPDGQVGLATSNDKSLIINRKTSNGDLVEFRKDGTTVGSIGNRDADDIFINTAGGTGSLSVGGIQYYAWSSGTIYPWTDNARDLGAGSNRWDDVYATNGTIQTSDANEKQQIASLTDAEITAAKAISQLFKTFKWNDAVAEKGDAARTHAGVIAQDVEAAMTAAGLDAGDYAFFISSTWWETQTEVPAVEAVEAVLDEDGNVVTEAIEAADAYTRTDTYETAEEAPEGATERTRLGIRYPELLAFVGAATEQRLANIETRLAALEAN